jgi:hypothetical protein
MLRWRRFLSVHRGVPHWVPCHYRQAVKSPLTRNWLTTTVLAPKHVPHSFWMWKKPLGVLGSLRLTTSGSSGDWYVPPLTGISLGWVLASLGVVCAVWLPTSPIITARGEPLTDFKSEWYLRTKLGVLSSRQGVIDEIHYANCICKCKSDNCINSYTHVWPCRMIHD